MGIHFKNLIKNVCIIQKWFIDNISRAFKVNNFLCHQYLECEVFCKIQHTVTNNVCKSSISAYKIFLFGNKSMK